MKNSVRVALIALGLYYIYAKLNAKLRNIYDNFNAKLCKISAKLNANNCKIYAKFKFMKDLGHIQSKIM